MIDITRALAIPGWMTPGELRWLAEQATRAQIVVECGSWQGRSTRALADHCPGTVYAIDPWDGPCYTEAGDLHPLDTRVWIPFSRHLRDHLLSEHVRAIHAKAATALPKLLADLGPVVDLLFIDADHRYRVCAADLVVAQPLVRSGGILAGHDYHNATWPGVTQAVDEAFGSAVQSMGGIWWVVQP